MKIAKVNIVLDYKNDVFRELEINVENNLEVLHHSIVAAFNLNVEEMASFYLSLIHISEPTRPY